MRQMKEQLRKEKDYDPQNEMLIKKDLETEIDRVKAEIRSENRELVVLEAEVLQAEELKAKGLEVDSAQAIPIETRHKWVDEKKKDLEILREREKVYEGGLMAFDDKIPFLVADFGLKALIKEVSQV